jgi:hypothetical protein
MAMFAGKAILLDEIKEYSFIARAMTAKML